MNLFVIFVYYKKKKKITKKYIHIKAKVQVKN